MTFDTGTLCQITLDLIPTSIMIVDGTTRIVYPNAAAKAMLSARDPIVADCGRLRASWRTATAALETTIKRVALEEGSAPATAVPLPYCDGNVAFAHVRRVEPLVLSSESRISGAVAVFITGPMEHLPLPVDAMMTYFELTRCEVHVLENIVSGKNRRETALELGVADSTVKSHLERIYTKTRTSNQQELRQLVRELSWKWFPKFSRSRGLQCQNR